MIKLAFLWHMHQPYYKNIADDSYLLPWVRLHGLKDYYGMVRILREFPGVKQNFNLVPSLLLQLQDYIEEKAREAMLDLSLVPALKLKEADKSYILRYFFYANKENVIARFPRYLELFEKRGFYETVEKMERAKSRFTPQDYLDLQVLQKLAWMDEEYLAEDPQVLRLVEKGRHYEESDKLVLRNKELELLGRIIPEYRDAQHRGQVELSTSPFYHPILPLLVSTRIARESNPNIQLPMSEFARPEDARMQIQRASAFHQTLFGTKPEGSWPSEGSVSEHVLPLFAEAGIKWIASDEEILLHSLETGPVADKARWCARNLYTVYQRPTSIGPVSMVFRDHVLSDLIGFSYARVPAEEAASDFVRRLMEVDERSKQENPNGPPPLVSIILDGENAWEHYPCNGRDFLRKLYEKISNESAIETVRIIDYVNEFSGTELPHLYPGSWIDHDYAIWIGHQEDNKGWDYLKEARDLIDYAIVNEPDKKEQIEKAYEEALIAEGSDWFWWFGDDHSSENDAEFDRLFRQHVSNIYHFLGKPVPEHLLMPIKTPRAPSLIYRVPRRFISPKLDGNITNYFEWLTAGYYFVADQQGTMHRAETAVKQLLFGFDLKNAYFRIDPHRRKADELLRDRYEFQIFLLPYFILTVSQKEGSPPRVVLERERDDTWILVDHECEVAAGSVLELKVPFSNLQSKSGDTIRFRISVLQNDLVFEEHPQSGTIQFQVPGPHFEEMDWEV